MKYQQLTDWTKIPVLMDINYCARLLGRSADSTKKLAQSGRLAGAVKVGGHWRVSRDALRAYIEGTLLT